MADDEDSDDPRMVEMELKITRKVEANAKQLRNIDDRLESLETLLRGFIDEQRGRSGGDTTEAED